MLELRLTPGPGPIDVALRLTEAGHSRRLAAAIPPGHLRTLLSRWREGEGMLAPLRSIWCEFDLDSDARKLPAPVVCAKLPASAAPTWIVDDLLPALQGHASTPERSRRVLACIQAIHAPARLLYVFSLRARGSNAIRLEILGLPPEGIRSYLRSVAPHLVAPVAGAAELFAEAENIHLSYDVGDTVLPRIGVEGSFPRLPRREPRWTALFDRLVARGLCTAEKRAAALAWPGYETFWTAPAAWPVRETGVHGFCFRGLSHVKVVWRPEHRPEAKVYLSCGFSVDGQATREDDAGGAVP
ncbi:MAG TPA: hypothetical protein VGC93_19995 [Thermoanaerobaculia bacterium]